MTPNAFEAGRPRISRPIRAMSRPLGGLGLPMAGKRWLPYFAILRHTGRRSGTAYSTPVVSLRTPDGFLIPLPFGDATQWARNLFAGGGGSLRRGGREHQIGEPRVVGRDEVKTDLPPFVLFLCRRLGLRQFVLVRRIAG